MNVFADIDGVLNNELWFSHREHVGMDPPCNCLDPLAIDLFSELITALDARVIISSDWRFAFGLSEIQAAFEHHGYTRDLELLPSLAPPAGLYPVMLCEDPEPHDYIDLGRGHDISHWLAQQPRPVPYITIDDNWVPGHQFRQIKVDDRFGLTSDHVTAAKEMAACPV